MPTYQYKREDGSIFEVFQSINDPALTHCPETGQTVQRMITGGGGVVYKGTGWYVTDYKNNGSKNSGATTSESTNSGTTSSEATPSSESTSSSQNTSTTTSTEDNS